MESVQMNLSQAVTIRIRKILDERKMSQYKLEQISGIRHNTMLSFMACKYKSCQLKTLALIIRALDLSFSEFFNDPIFENEDLIIE